MTKRSTEAQPQDENDLIEGGVIIPITQGKRVNTDNIYNLMKQGWAEVEGASYAALARWLNERGITTQRGNPWTHRTVRDVIVREYEKRTGKKWEPPRK